MSVEDVMLRCDGCGLRKSVKPLIQEHDKTHLYTVATVKIPGEWDARFGGNGTDCYHRCDECRAKGVTFA